MATLNKIIYDILEDVSSHHLIDDFDIDDRQVIYKLNVQRALWLRNEYNKPGRTIDPFVTQSLGCVELELADSSECPDLPTGCSILRTKCEIPKPVELHNRMAITKVGSVDKLNYFFSLVSYEQAIFSGNGKFNGKSIFAFVLNNRMYFKVNSAQAKMLRRVSIRGIFEDPEMLKDFCDPNGTACFSKDDDYPVSAWMIPFIQEQVVNSFLKSFQVPEDNSNDASSNEDRNAR